MNLTVVLEHRYDRTPDGQVWTPGMHDYAFWKRYLMVFERVQVVARMREVPSVDASMRPAGGEGVSFTAVPHFIGPSQYLKVQRQVRRVIAGALHHPAAGAVLLRVPGSVCNVAFKVLGNRPFAVEVLGDPYDLFAPGVQTHPLRPVFRFLNTRQLRAQCRRAKVAAYVTRAALQRRYPTRGQSFGVSDVELPPQAYAAQGRRWHPGPYQAVMVCTLEVNYKGVELAIRALALLRERGLTLRLKLVGGGALRPRFEALAAELGLGQQVEFVGSVSGGAGVRAQLDQADFFLMPSLQEGLPRALVEAMARGLPALGSTIGGIPELLEPPELFPAGNVPAIAEAVARLLGNENRYNEVSERNLTVAQSYGDAELHDLRMQFYSAVRDRAGQMR